MAVVQVNFGISAIERARSFISDAVARVTQQVMNGRLSEAEYNFQSGVAYGLQQALNALADAEKEVAKEK